MAITLPHGFDNQFIRSGLVLSDPEYPINQVYKFRAKIQVYELDLPIIKGQSVIVYSFSNKVPGKIKSLESIINQQTDEVIKNRPKKLLEGNFA